MITKIPLHPPRRLSPMADTCFPRFLLLKLVMYVVHCCSLLGGWSVRLLPGGGGGGTHIYVQYRYAPQ